MLSHIESRMSIGADVFERKTENIVAVAVSKCEKHSPGFS
jgi:hypothetical protein